MNDKTVTLPREVARRLLLCVECHDITGGDIDTLRAALEAVQPVDCRGYAELRNIADSKRFNREMFRDDTEWADWAQSRARHTVKQK